MSADGLVGLTWTAQGREWKVLRRDEERPERHWVEWKGKDGEGKPSSGEQSWPDGMIRAYADGGAKER